MSERAKGINPDLLRRKAIAAHKSAKRKHHVLHITGRFRTRHVASRYDEDEDRIIRFESKEYNEPLDLTEFKVSATPNCTKAEAREYLEQYMVLFR